MNQAPKIRHLTGPGLAIALALTGLLGWRLVLAAPGQAADGLCRWERLAPDAPRAQHSLVDIGGAALLGYGGVFDPTSEAVTDSLRLLDLDADRRGAWRELESEGALPAPRAQHSAVLRRAEGLRSMLAHGGVDRLPPGGTFTWQSPLPGGPMPHGPGSLLAGTQALDLERDPPRWSELPGSGAGPRADHSAIYHAEADAMIVFGGRLEETAESRSDDLRRLRLSPEPAWEPIELPDGPGPRFAHSAIYDPVGQRMLVYGGTTDWTEALDELWSLELSAGWSAARWQRIEPEGKPPPARFDHLAIHLPEPGWMLVFGGSPDGLGALRDLAALDLRSEPPRWLELEIQGPLPPNLQGMVAAFSAEAGMAVLHGGQDEGAIERLSWGLRCLPSGAPTWTPAPSPSPSTTSGPGPAPELLLPWLQGP